MSTWNKPLKNSLKGLLRYLGYQLAPYPGYKIVPSGVVDPPPFASHLRALFEKLEINCVLDIGAHIGTYRDFLRKDVGRILNTRNNCSI